MGSALLMVAANFTKLLHVTNIDSVLMSRKKETVKNTVENYDKDGAREKVDNKGLKREETSGALEGDSR